MICKTEADLHDEYARVIRMCVGMKVKPERCVKNDGSFGNGWRFDDEPSDYTFALAIVYDDKLKEDRPVFEGDVLYDRDGNPCINDTGINWDYSRLSWNPPKKKTFMLNREELPSPDGGAVFGICVQHKWRSVEDAAKVEAAINKLLSGE